MFCNQNTIGNKQIKGYPHSFLASSNSQINIDHIHRKFYPKSFPNPIKVTFNQQLKRNHQQLKDEFYQNQTKKKVNTQQPQFMEDSNIPTEPINISRQRQSFPNKQQKQLHYYRSEPELDNQANKDFEKNCTQKRKGDQRGVTTQFYWPNRKQKISMVSYFNLINPIENQKKSIQKIVKSQRQNQTKSQKQISSLFKGIFVDSRVVFEPGENDGKKLASGGQQKSKLKLSHQIPYPDSGIKLSHQIPSPRKSRLKSQVQESLTQTRKRIFSPQNLKIKSNSLNNSPNCFPIQKIFKTHTKTKSQFKTYFNSDSSKIKRKNKIFSNGKALIPFDRKNTLKVIRAPLTSPLKIVINGKQILKNQTTSFCQYVGPERSLIQSPPMESITTFSRIPFSEQSKKPNSFPIYQRSPSNIYGTIKSKKTPQNRKIWYFGPLKSSAFEQDKTDYGQSQQEIGPSKPSCMVSENKNVQMQISSIIQKLLGKQQNSRYYDAIDDNLQQQAEKFQPVNNKSKPTTKRSTNQKSRQKINISEDEDEKIIQSTQDLLNMQFERKIASNSRMRKDYFNQNMMNMMQNSRKRIIEQDNSIVNMFPALPLFKNTSSTDKNFPGLHQKEQEQIFPSKRNSLNRHITFGNSMDTSEPASNKNLLHLKQEIKVLNKNSGQKELAFQYQRNTKMAIFGLFIVTILLLLMQTVIF